MDRNKRNLLLVLGMMCVFCSFSWAGDVPGKKIPETASIPVVFPDKKEIQTLIAEDLAASDIVLDAAWGDRNPLDRSAIDGLPAPEPEKVDNKKFSLTGILWTGDKPSAIINDQVLGLSASILGMKVQEIKETGVILSDGTSQVVLSLRK